MYVDESGDPGSSVYSSDHYILSGLIVNQEDWEKYLKRLKEFRNLLKKNYNLNLRTEIHASELIRINKELSYKKIHKSNRIKILSDYCDEIPKIFSNAKVINVCLKKSELQLPEKVQHSAWIRLIQRYDNYLKWIVKDKGIIISDDTNINLIIGIHRKMRTYNPIFQNGNKFNVTTDNVIEDVFQRASHYSYFIQTVDVISHLLYRKEYPKGSLKKFGLENFFDRLSPVLLLDASKEDPLGIVRK